MIAVEVSVGKDRAVAIEHLRRNPRHKLLLQPLRCIGIDGRIVGQTIRHVVAVERTVGRVRVDQHIGLPSIDQSHQRSNLECVEFDEVAIEVLSIRIFASSHPQRWALLARAMHGAHPLVAIGIETRKEYQNNPLKPFGLAPLDHIPGQCHESFFAVALSAVDTPDHHDHQPRIVFGKRQWVGLVLRDDQRPQRSLFVCDSDLYKLGSGIAIGGRIAIGEFFEKLQHVGLS